MYTRQWRQLKTATANMTPGIFIFIFIFCFGSVSWCLFVLFLCFRLRPEFTGFDCSDVAFYIYVRTWWCACGGGRGFFSRNCSRQSIFFHLGFRARNFELILEYLNFSQPGVFLRALCAFFSNVEIWKFRHFEIDIISKFCISISNFDEIHNIIELESFWVFIVSLCLCARDYILIY